MHISECHDKTAGVAVPARPRPPVELIMNHARVKPGPYTTYIIRNSYTVTESETSRSINTAGRNAQAGPGGNKNTS